MSELRPDDEVIKLQLILDSFLPVPLRVKPDGAFGPRTRDAVIAFQKMKNLPPDGVVGQQTRRVLGLPGPTLRLPAKAGGSPIQADGSSAQNQPPVIPQSLAAAAPWMTIAAGEFGVHRDMIHHHEMRIIEFLKTTTLTGSDADTDSTPWCSAFVNWVITKSGRTGTNDALAASWLTWKHGKTIPAPVPGSIVVIKSKASSSDAFTGSSTGNHVGFCLEYSQLHVRLLGGNQGSKVGVAYFNFTKWDLRGATWPTP
jgi:uncharacterized protein (TIGR02594 family)